MKRKLSKKTIGLTAAALMMTASIGVGSAMAYFTTYAQAKGGVALELGFTDTEVEEDVIDEKKQLQLKNTGDYDCYVRLKALTGAAYASSITYAEKDGSGKWTPGADGYYYYSDIVAPGGVTSQLDVGFQFPTEEPKDFNIIIIQECTPVLYDEDGNPYADWNEIADVSQSIYQ